jgi:probable F420-dependent oxidoreductase
MDFGVVLQTTPPSARVVDLAKRAETYGFTHVWTFDSHILWQEPYVIYSRILDETRNVVVGPMVTNPATRDWTVTASLYATLNEMYGNRTVCGIGRGDSAVRVTNGAPTTLATLRESVHVIRELANGRSVDYKGSELRLPWASRSELEVWVAAYGPKALALTGEVGDGFILQLADLSIAEWTIGAVRKAAADAGRDPESITICVAAPAYVTDGSDAQLAHGREQCRWFGGMVGNHVADIVARYGKDAPVPKALTDYIEGRQGYDAHHVRARRDRRPVLHRRPAGGARGADAPAEGAGCRPVRDLPPARRQGPHPRLLRRARAAGRGRAREGPFVTRRT